MLSAFEQPSRSYQPHLDALRGICALSVIYTHLPFQIFYPDPKMEGAINPGYFGMELFFLLSGFLITRILVSDRMRGTSLARFYISRAARVLPIYLLTIAFFLVVAPGMYLLWSALFVSNYTTSFDLTENPLRHSWSLSLEEQFYCTWPFAVYFLTHDKVKKGAWWVFGIGFLFTFLYPALIPEWPIVRVFAYKGLPTRMVSLALGSLVALYEPWLFAEAKRWQGLVVKMALAAMVIGPMFWFKVTPFDLQLPIMIMSGAIFIGVVGWSKGLGDKPMGWLGRSLAWQGKVSYGVYLYHYPLFLHYDMIRFKPDNPPPLQNWILCLFFTYLLATISFYGFEKHIMDYTNRRLREWDAKKRAAAEEAKMKEALHE